MWAATKRPRCRLAAGSVVSGQLLQSDRGPSRCRAATQTTTTTNTTTTTVTTTGWETVWMVFRMSLLVMKVMSVVLGDKQKARCESLDSGLGKFLVFLTGSAPPSTPDDYDNRYAYDDRRTDDGRRSNGAAVDDDGVMGEHEPLSEWHEVSRLRHRRLWTVKMKSGR